MDSVLIFFFFFSLWIINEFLNYSRFPITQTFKGNLKKGVANGTLKNVGLGKF